MDSSTLDSSMGESVSDSNFNKHCTFDMKDAVKLPLGEDTNEWIASNLFDLHKQISMLFTTIINSCSIQDSCRKMTAGQYIYLWTVGNKTDEYCAVEYIQHTLDWVQEQLDDEDLFPTINDKEFPEHFLPTCKTISKRLLRVFGHICNHHLDDVKQLREEKHMNTSLKHILYFVQEFKLVTEKDLEPLKGYLEKSNMRDILMSRSNLK